MGLSIHLDQRQIMYVTPDIETNSRLDIASHVLAFYRDYFTPKTLSIWRRAPLQSLGGTLLKQISLSSPIDRDLSDVKQYLNAFSWQEKAELIFVFTGDWTIGNTETAGFLNIYGRTRWSSTYGDIELNIYPTQDFPDLIHLMKANPELEGLLVHDFLMQFSTIIKDEPLKVAVMYFGVGVPSKYEVNVVTGAYYRSEDTLWADCLRTIIEEQGQSVKDSFTPYTQTFLVSGLKGVPAFTSFVEELLAKHHVVREESGSIVLIGRNLDSFRNFYEELSLRVLKPVAEELPNKTELLERIKSAIEGRGLKQTKL